ncbi:MAG: hypothetical protein ACLQGU_05845 [bacterium]
MVKFLILSLGALFIIACGHVEGTIQKAEKGLIVFSGNLGNVSIKIDELEPFTPSHGKHYQLSPGKHVLTAYRDGTPVLNKIIFLDNQVTMEIRIP